MKKLILLCLLSSNCFAASWECVNRAAACNTWRMEVPTGWIVSSDNTDNSYAMTFVPDPEHKWKV
jgi:hypothetical protein